MHKQYGITVKDVLTIDVVNRLQVVAGHNGLGRFIKLVNIIEMPDIMEWIVEGNSCSLLATLFGNTPN